MRRNKTFALPFAKIAKESRYPRQKLLQPLQEVIRILGDLLRHLIFLFLISFSSAFAGGPPAAPLEREFWVWDLSVMPPGSRQAKASLRAIGDRSLVYVEDKLWNKEIQPEFVKRLQQRLEQLTPPSSLFPNLGIVEIEEKLFAPLPKIISTDERVIVLFADLGKYKNFEFDGFFNAFDQLPDEISRADGQRSNESNVIYINGFRQNEDYTTGVIAHELQHLLHYHVGPKEGQDLWLSETLGEAAMLLTGYDTDQGHANRYAKEPHKTSLVSQTYVQYGPQLLFSAFLLDSMPNKKIGLQHLVRSPKGGKEAVEGLFHKDGARPINFDLVYSNFLTYLFDREGKNVPYTLPHSDLTVPNFSSQFKIESYPARISGTLMPYTFTLVDLPKALPANALIKLERITDDDSKDCGLESSLLWKPVSPKKLAIYSVGCEQTGKFDAVKYQLQILSAPLLLPHSPLKIGL